MFNALQKVFSQPALTPSEVSYADFEKADARVIAEVIRQGECRLGAQLQTALASDTRAVGLASLQATASVALVVAAAQTEIAGWSELACYLSSISLLGGAILAGWAMRSVGFAFVGNRPKFWVGCIEDGDTINACLAGTAVHMDSHLAHNDAIMKQHGRLTNLSLACLAIAPVLALLVIGTERVLPQ